MWTHTSTHTGQGKETESENEKERDTATESTQSESEELHSALLSQSIRHTKRIRHKLQAFESSTEQNSV